MRLGSNMAGPDIGRETVAPAPDDLEYATVAALVKRLDPWRDEVSPRFLHR